ncbi:MAG: dihydroorotate dehydrogenase electron transfer subunit, partial [Muribaculaceae bacterium]|nr:dihydroorotate dehydrogenase electron transfer subunit [Muribaculaceae bacterium]
AGTHGVVTAHSRMSLPADMVYCCGPAPMMKAVARAAARLGVSCEVSLENVMACGLGACLCCVEKTTRGNVCVCTEGPVFNTNKLLWQD